VCQIGYCLSITWRGRLREGSEGLHPINVLFIVARVIDLSGNQKDQRMRNDSHFSAEMPKRIQQALVCSLLLLLSAGSIGCNIGQKTTTLTLNPIPASIQAGTQAVFTAYIDHNNGNFEGATFTLTSNGTACSPACGTLSGYTNVGSSGNGDTATITYTAPATPPSPNSVTVTATSIENTSSSGTGTFSVTATVAALAAQTATLEPDAIGVAYIPVTLQASGGVVPYTWSINSGSLPPGLSMSNAGAVSGTPTAAGAFNFNAQVQDSTGTTATASETITIIGTPQVNITGVTVHPDSPDSQFVTVTTDDGSQIEMWGDKDSSGMAADLRSLRVQTSDGTTSTFSFDSTGHLLQFGPSTGTVFNLNWQSDTSATVVAYTADGTAIAGPLQISLASSPATNSVPAIGKLAGDPKGTSRRRSKTLDIGLDTEVPQNNFEIQVNRCGLPFDGAVVALSVQSSVLPTSSLAIGPLTGSGTYDIAVPVAIPSSVVAPTVAFCDSVANYVSSFITYWSNDKVALAQTCMVMTAAAVITSGPAGLAAATEIEAACVAALGALYEADAIEGVVSPSTPAVLESYCNNGIPAVAAAINATTVSIQATVQLPGIQPVTLGPTPYGGLGPFPGSGVLPPLVVNVDTLGVCDIAGSWAGGWSRIDQMGMVHSGGLSAGITDTSTPDTYDVALTVTAKSGSGSTNFSGVATSETDLGDTFSFGPAVFDGYTGTAVGYLTPDGKTMSGSYTPAIDGAWSMIKSSSSPNAGERKPTSSN